MGRYLYDNFSSARALFEEASDTLKQNFRALCFDGPESDLSLTENTQPALLLVSVASFHALAEVATLDIAAGSGHSVGEYAALVASQSISFTDALKAVRLRGQYMQQAVPVGTSGMMAVVGASDELVQKLCSHVIDRSGFRPLEPANFNAPGQVVVSGSLPAIQWARQNLRLEELDPQAGKVRLIPLNVSAAFHSTLMKPAQEQMAVVLRDMPLSAPRWPVVQNFTAKAETEPASIRDNLIAQISGAVRWVECVDHLARERGCQKFIEFGSGKVLAGLLKKIDSDRLQTFNMTNLDEFKTLERMIALEKTP